VRAGSAEAWRHHKLHQDSGAGGAEVSALQEHGAAGAAGRQQRGAVPEGGQPEGTFTQNCRREEEGHGGSGPRSVQFTEPLDSVWVSMGCIIVETEL